METDAASVSSLAKTDPMVATLRLDLSRKVRAGDLAVPSVPVVVAEAMRLARQPETTIAELERLIERDASVAGRLLSIANSPLVRGAREVTSIHEAILRLGAEELGHTLFSIFVETRLFQSKVYGPLFATLWRHSYAVACMARRVADLTDLDGDMLFLAGLLHDVGKVALVGNLPGPMQEARLISEEALESVVYDMHALAGGLAARSWNLPDDISRAIIHHHDPAEDGRVAHAVYVANVLVYRHRLGLDETYLRARDAPNTTYRPLFEEYTWAMSLDPATNAVFTGLGLDESALAALKAEAEAIQAEMQASFSRRIKKGQIKQVQRDIQTARREPPSSHRGLVVLGAVLAAAILLGSVAAVFLARG